MGCKMPKKYIYPIIGTSNLLTNIYGEFLRIMEYVIVKSNFKNKKRNNALVLHFCNAWNPHYNKINFRITFSPRE